MRYYNENVFQQLHERGVLKYACVRVMKQIYLNILTKNKNEVLVDNFSFYQSRNTDSLGVEIMNIISELYWFDARLLDLYGEPKETIRGIAKKTGIPVRTVWNRLRIAKEKVKLKYEKL